MFILLALLETHRITARAKSIQLQLTKTFLTSYLVETRYYDRKIPTRCVQHTECVTFFGQSFWHPVVFKTKHYYIIYFCELVCEFKDYDKNEIKLFIRCQNIYWINFQLQNLQFGFLPDSTPGNLSCWTVVTVSVFPKYGSGTNLSEQNCLLSLNILFSKFCWKVENMEIAVC